MLKTIRRILLCVPVLAVFCTAAAPALWAEEPPLTQDYNKFWQVMEAPNAPPDPNPNQDYNEYWEKVQIQQDYQQLHPQQ